MYNNVDGPATVSLSTLERNNATDELEKLAGIRPRRKRKDPKERVSIADARVSGLESQAFKRKIGMI